MKLRFNKALFLSFLCLILANGYVLATDSDEGPDPKRARLGEAPIGLAPEPIKQEEVLVPPEGSAAVSDSLADRHSSASLPNAQGAAPSSATSINPVMPDGKPFTDPRFDSSFKHMLGLDEDEKQSEEDPYHILSSFVSAFADRQIKITKTLNPNIPPIRERGESQQKMDIACQDNRGVRYNIEMQRARQSYWDARALYYMTSLYETQISTADYGSLKPVVGISILEFNREDFSTYKRHYKLADTKTFPAVGVVPSSPVHCIDSLELIEISLAKVNLSTFPDSLERQWLTLLITAADSLSVPDAITNTQVRQAWEKLRFETFGGTAKALYTKEQADYQDEQLRIQEAIEKTRVLERAEGIKEGMEKGKIEGELNKALEIASQLMTIGMDDATIHAMTKLSPDKIVELRLGLSSQKAE